MNPCDLAHHILATVDMDQFNELELLLIPEREFDGWRCYRSVVSVSNDGSEKAAGFGCMDGMGHQIRLALAFCSTTEPDKNTAHSFLFTSATMISLATRCETSASSSPRNKAMSDAGTSTR
jgi:hypothetical protein